MTKIRDIEQLLDVAAKVFAEKGYDAARLEDIATELGVLQGSLYYHVASKADLLVLIQERRFRAIKACMEGIAASALAPQEKLSVALREHLRFLDEFFPESSEWFTEPAQGRLSLERYAEWRAHNRSYVDVLEGIVREGVETGQLRRDLDAAVAVRGMIGMCNWLPRWYRKGDRLSINQISDTLISMVIDGLRGAAAGE